MRISDWSSDVCSSDLEEDPEDKVVIVTAEDEGHPDGFWPGEKDEQSRAYAKRATGNYLWQIDVDEFYRSEDIEAVIAMLRSIPEVATISFRQITFWGGFDYIADRSEEHTSELQSLMRISYAVFCLK